MGLMCGLNELIYAKGLEQGLAHGKHYIYVSYDDNY